MQKERNCLEWKGRKTEWPKWRQAQVNWHCTGDWWSFYSILMYIFHIKVAYWILHDFTHKHNRFSLNLFITELDLTDGIADQKLVSCNMVWVVIDLLLNKKQKVTAFELKIKFSWFFFRYEHILLKNSSFCFWERKKIFILIDIFFLLMIQFCY